MKVGYVMMVILFTYKSGEFGAVEYGLLHKTETEAVEPTSSTSGAITENQS